MTKIAWRVNGQMRYAPDLYGSELKLCYVQWVEARRRFPCIRAAFDDYLPAWFPHFVRDAL